MAINQLISAEKKQVAQLYLPSQPKLSPYSNVRFFANGTGIAGFITAAALITAAANSRLSVAVQVRPCFLNGFTYIKFFEVFL